MTKNKATKSNISRFPKKYDTVTVLDWVTEHYNNRNKKIRVEFDGHQMKPRSLRYRTFISSGCDCVVCGIKGQFFYKERSAFIGKIENTTGGYHFNLYGTNKHGEEVLMTKDHIVARSLGGADSVLNMQTMCTECNLEKGSMTVEERDQYIIDKGTDNE